MGDLGRILVVFGIVIVVFGIGLMLMDRLPWLGRLPGDVHIQRGNWSFHFPIVTSLLLSVVLTLVFYLIGLIGRR
jgi:hypothetical protein